MTQKIIAITGAGGYLGQRLVARLALLPWVERIIALDLKPIASDGHILSYRIDVSDTDTLRAIMAEHGVTHLVHAAFQIVRPVGWSNQQWHAANVHGSQSVIGAALRSAQPMHLTFVSSVAVYGYHAANAALRLKEDAPIRPTMLYGRHKVEVEALIRMVRALSRTAFAPHTNLRVAILRAAAIAGPRGAAGSSLRALTAQPMFVVSNGGHALTQALHEDDAADLVRLIIDQDAVGLFNAAPADQASWAEIGRLSKRPLLSVPRPVLNQMTRFNGILPAMNGFTRDVVDLFSESLVVDSGAAQQQLGWVPRYSTCDAYYELFKALGTAR